ncbi:MAG: hypothetical protein QOK21_260 [Solirubrobacteraceae bacterium]|jgi:hypothetical protein|nr:hypothetical protein [Solirubrobacteraceae bacterium]
MNVRSLLAALTGAVLLAVPATAGAATPDGLVTSGVPTQGVTPIFSHTKQNEPAVAVDPADPSRKAAGSNDEIDDEACAAGDPETCPFTPGVGVSGVYFSRDGFSWTQPVYQGFTARDCNGPAACTPHPGPIGTLPNFYANGLTSDGDPALVYGPRRSANGRFSWSAGSRLYYASLASNFPGRQAFQGAEAITSSYTDNDGATWSNPVIVSRQSSATFSDKEQIWADNASSSPNFGNVYICNVSFRGNGRGGGGEPVMLHRSTDGGLSWRTTQISEATNNSQTGGRQGCAVRTDSRGTTYVYWVGTDIGTGGTVFFQRRSTNGGQTFDQKRIVARLTDAGLPDPATGRLSFDGVAGARTSTFPSVDIANGAPTGGDATNEIVITGTDGPTPSDTQPGPNERAIVRYSTDGGNSFRDAPVASAGGDRPDFPAIAISPDGRQAYVTYDAFHEPWQHTTANPRPMEGVVRAARVDPVTGAIGAWSELHRGVTGDARGSSQNGLTAEFLGDYNYAFATRSGVTAVWNDVRNAQDCPPIDVYRQKTVQDIQGGAATADDEDVAEARADTADAEAAATSDGTTPGPVNQECPGFGNSDIYGGTYAP